MKAVFRREVKSNMKLFLIWTLAVGGIGLVCILMYESMQGDMKELADSFSQMGAFSDAFGMSTLSIATVKGFFATEVGTVHGLGSGMFAAVLAIGILSGEEEGHTGEFLFSLPLKRRGVVAVKGLFVLLGLTAFTVITGLLYSLGFLILGEDLPAGEFLAYMAGALLMNIEIAAFCLVLSSLSGKNRMGLGIGIALIFYLFDLLGRVIPVMKDYLFLGPYSYANAPEILSGKSLPAGGMLLAGGLILAGVGFTFYWYDRRDLMA